MTLLGLAALPRSDGSEPRSRLCVCRPLSRHHGDLVPLAAPLQSPTLQRPRGPPPSGRRRRAADAAVPAGGVPAVPAGAAAGGGSSARRPNPKREGDGFPGPGDPPAQPPAASGGRGPGQQAGHRPAQRPGGLPQRAAGDPRGTAR